MHTCRYTDLKAYPELLAAMTTKNGKMFVTSPHYEAYEGVGVVGLTKEDRQVSHRRGAQRWRKQTPALLLTQHGACIHIFSE